MASNAISLRGITVSYGQGPALDGIDLDIAAGATTAVLGANGAGKTTALNVIAGILKPSAGRVIDSAGTEVKRRTSIIRPGVAMSPEGRKLFGQMTVEENLLLGAHGLRNSRPNKDKMAEIFDMFPRVAERRRQAAGTLSGGEQQMVAIGRALMREPGLLLLDEPTLGLSPRIAGIVADMIARIAAGGLTVVLVEQDAAVALALAERAYVLVNGRIGISGEARDMDPREILKTYFETDARTGTQTI
ncbi:ABC transporter ATP-binding protein [Streptomyces viridiviolaceus]